MRASCYCSSRKSETPHRIKLAISTQVPYVLTTVKASLYCQFLLWSRRVNSSLHGQFEIALEIAAKIASVNGPWHTFRADKNKFTINFSKFEPCLFWSRLNSLEYWNTFKMSWGSINCDQNNTVQTLEHVRCKLVLVWSERAIGFDGGFGATYE